LQLYCYVSVAVNTVMLALLHRGPKCRVQMVYELCRYELVGISFELKRGASVHNDIIDALQGGASGAWQFSFLAQIVCGTSGAWLSDDALKGGTSGEWLKDIDSLWCTYCCPRHYKPYVKCYY